MKFFKPFTPKWYWILLGSAGKFNTDFDAKKNSGDDDGQKEMNLDIQNFYKIFKTNPKIKSDGNF